MIKILSFYVKKVVGIIETAVNDDGKTDAAIPEETVYTTPSRFGVKNEGLWCHGGGDNSISFSVDSEDISIAGFCVFGGPNATRYEAEMSNEQGNLFQRLNGKIASYNCVLVDFNSVNCN